MTDIDQYDAIDASPVKRFFVEMLTRDIQIEDAILDLLDNCVDGIQRSRSISPDSDSPYQGFWAKISVTENSFEIEDNCGGIPWSEHGRAFRMGRPKYADDSVPAMSVGVYGIGMKRALFKLGRSSFIVTQNGQHSYQVFFTEDWINNEDTWNLSVEPCKERMLEDGTHLIIEDLNEDVRERFNAKSFVGDLLKKISSHYAVILRKGFRVEVNGLIAEPNPIVMRYASEDSINGVVRPYIFKSNQDGVEIFLAVGLREPIPGLDRISDEQEGVKFSSDYAGWTVICNDRVVLYCDRSELTGWGLFGVPRYHTQFIAISGTVEFRGSASKLPTTTTKRGLKFESSLYQQVLQRMIQGIKYFTEFTNNWKSLEAQAEKIVSPIPALSYSQIKEKAQQDLIFNNTKIGLVGSQYVPSLPVPESTKTEVRISYNRSKEEVFELADKLLPDAEEIKPKDLPRQVGIASFEFASKHLIKK